MSVLTATVKEVPSGDCIVVVEAPKGEAPPDKFIYLSGVMAPRLALKTSRSDRDDDPFAFQSREFLREKLIGKPVSVTIEYQEENRQYGVVQCNGENVSVAVIRSGFAKVRPPRQQSTRKMDDLYAAEAAAKKEKLGLWTDNSAKIESAVRQIQWIALDAVLTKAFVNANKNKTHKAIVEYVRDAGCYRVYFPALKVNAQVALSGIQVDSYRRIEGLAELQAEPFAAEAKYFVEMRILSRLVDVRIEDGDDSGCIRGSVIHPQLGNIALLVLRNGFAKIRQGEVRLVENPAQYRETEKEAQRNRIRKWRGWVAEEVEAVREYQARVVEILSGDFIIVCPVNIEDHAEKKLLLSSIRCPRMATQANPKEEPWAFDAKEFVRNKLIGKKVTVVVEYSRVPSSPVGGGASLPSSDSSGKTHFVSIYLEKNKPSINEQLISEGLARIAVPRGDDPRADNFELLVQKEKEAAEKKKGIHGLESAAPKHPINDLTRPGTNLVSKKFLADSLKRKGIVEGIVEYVYHGGKFRIRIPSETLMVPFILSGIQCPQLSRGDELQKNKPGAEFAWEAFQFSRESVMQRLVNIKVESADRVGNFFGILWFGSTCINVRLVEQGFASVREQRQPSSISAELEEAGKTAREKRIGLWSLPGAKIFGSEESDEVEEEGKKTEIPECVISVRGHVNDFYTQEASTSKVELLQEGINSYVKGLDKASQYTLNTLPKAGDFVLSKFSEDGEWYRGKIESVDRSNNEFQVLYIDFGNSEFVGYKELYRCPQQFHPSKYPSLSRHCALVGLKPPPEMEIEGADAFDALVSGKTFRCVIESTDPQTRKSLVQLFPLNKNTTRTRNENNNNNEHPIMTINEELVLQGFAIVDKKAKTELLDLLIAAEMKARRGRLNVWCHGDIGDEADDEDLDNRRPGFRSRR